MSTQTTNPTCQYMTFKLGNELFAIDVAQVREVLEITDITKVPAAPEYIRGVVNVRGTCIPVVDLRLRFGLPEVEETVNTRIIIMELDLDGEATIVGGLADSVHEVIGIEPDSINPPPRLASRWRAEFIRGMGRRADEFIIILEVRALFASDQLAVIEEAAGRGIEAPAA